jgi:hypothetical protein
MNILDSQGRRISLLNDDNRQTTTKTSVYSRTLAPELNRAQFSRSQASISPALTSSNPSTPSLQRCDSQDSSNFGRTPSPITPHQLGMEKLTLHNHSAGGYRPPPTAYGEPELYGSMTPYMQMPYDPIRTSRTSNEMQRPAPYPLQVQTTTTTPSPQQQSTSQPYRSRRAPVKSQKNTHPCPLASQYGCERYFTTSGHAARHAKIHSGEKLVQCPECPKTFARKDNMDQHRKTHQRASKQQIPTIQSTQASTSSARKQELKDDSKLRKARKMHIRATQSPERMGNSTSDDSNSPSVQSPDSAIFPDHLSRQRSLSGSGLDMLADAASALS